MKRTLLSIALAASASLAGASQVAVDWHTAGDGLLTLDTATGLQWLDLSQTYNQTVAAVLPQTAAGMAFDGFRLATASEVHTLMGDAGIPFSTSTGAIGATAADLAAANALTDLLSETVGQHFGSSYHGSRGHLTDAGADLAVGYYTTDNGTGLFNDYFTGFSDWPGAGVWLVRTGDTGRIPEPGTLGLLAAALAGVALARKNKAA
jgi:hypothetical protein